MTDRKQQAQQDELTQLLDFERKKSAQYLQELAEIKKHM